MKIKNQLNIGRLIAKIDNDFNLSESDWIPRVGAWCIDALAQLKCLPYKRKKRELEVSERIAQHPCQLNARGIRVFDMNGCEIPNLDSAKLCQCSGSGSKGTGSEIAVIDNNDKTGRNFMTIGTVVNKSANRNFVIQGNCIELNFDTDKIVVESDEVATYYDEYYQCEVPYIYDNGLLLEALAWYCLFKYLSRGSKHPVYDLKSPNQAINPYHQWMNIKAKAANSVKVDLSNTTDGWNNFFYNSTFLPRG